MLRDRPTPELYSLLLCAVNPLRSGTRIVSSRLCVPSNSSPLPVTNNARTAAALPSSVSRSGASRKPGAALRPSIGTIIDFDRAAKVSRDLDRREDSFSELPLPAINPLSFSALSALVAFCGLLESSLDIYRFPSSPYPSSIFELFFSSRV